MARPNKDNRLHNSSVHRSLGRRLFGKIRAQNYEGKFYRRNKETGTILRKPGSGKASKWNKSAKEISGEPKILYGETTGLELEKLLRRNGITVSGSHQPQKFLWASDTQWTLLSSNNPLSSVRTYPYVLFATPGRTRRHARSCTRILPIR